MFDAPIAPRGPTCDVLVLEDDPIVRLVTTEMLEDAGFSVREAANSTEALAVLEEASCRVLLVDMMLGADSPIRDGRKVATEVLRRHPQQLVVYVSGLAVDLGRPFTARETSLMKPYLPDSLISAVRGMLECELADQLAA